MQHRGGLPGAQRDGLPLGLLDEHRRVPEGTQIAEPYDLDELVASGGGAVFPGHEVVGADRLPALPRHIQVGAECAEREQADVHRLGALGARRAGAVPGRGRLLDEVDAVPGGEGGGERAVAGGCSGGGQGLLPRSRVHTARTMRCGLSRSSVCGCVPSSGGHAEAGVPQLHGAAVRRGDGGVVAWAKRPSVPGASSSLLGASMTVSPSSGGYGSGGVGGERAGPGAGDEVGCGRGESGRREVRPVRWRGGEQGPVQAQPQRRLVQPRGAGRRGAAVGGEGGRGLRSGAGLPPRAGHGGAGHDGPQPAHRLQESGDGEGDPGVVGGHGQNEPAAAGETRRYGQRDAGPDLRRVEGALIEMLRSEGEDQQARGPLDGDQARHFQGRLLQGEALPAHSDVQEIR
ncbi:hypothetical protein GCM10020000_01700 [Streptomyces olivoverticillatus]